jgi:hypothetical protein
MNEANPGDVLISLKDLTCWEWIKLAIWVDWLNGQLAWGRVSCPTEDTCSTVGDYLRATRVLLDPHGWVPPRPSPAPLRSMQPGYYTGWKFREDEAAVLADFLDDYYTL